MIGVVRGYLWFPRSSQSIFYRLGAPAQYKQPGRDQSKEVNLIGLQKVQRVKIRELFDNLLN
ncbi:12546_t:CDS:2 [Rhizophagus irregularis]|uniref:Uncharacterized protein n=1 Tax=Rhizophagus irregularis (strain DAOM 181602 / DAOM 197198 / MUCL 43194) TaxID=747089 RepID=U9U0A7_RHIID|nr:12546_t:CDS:2 [Rhizophagus irregularis]